MLTEQKKNAKTGAPKSPLMRAIESRPRRCIDVPVSEVFTRLEGDFVIKVRLATRGEIDRAAVLAHEYVRRISAGVEAALEDSEILTDAKNAFILAEACRDDADPDNRPAFPSGEWLMNHATTHEIGALFNAYVEAVRSSGELDARNLTDEQVAALALASAATAESDLPNLALLRMPPEHLAEFSVRVSAKLAEILRRQAEEEDAREREEEDEERAETGEPVDLEASDEDEQAEASEREEEPGGDAR